jgi:hemolysin III
VLHTWAFVAVVPLGAVLLALAGGWHARLAIVVYLLGVATMFGVSALYHRGNWSERAHDRLRRADHSTIFLAIAGTYTPIAALHTHGWVRNVLLLAVWVGAVLGIVLQWLPIQPPRWLFTAVYAFVGWVAALGFPQLLHGMGVAGFALVVFGGVVYTAGAVVYALKRPDPRPTVFGYHEVFHACTLVGALSHYVAILIVTAQ